MGYTKQAIKGISWIAALRTSTRIVAIVRTALLARILTPSQFGIFGIASLVLAFFEVLTETGINVFLVQQKKDVKEYINSAWFISISRGIFLSVIIVLLAPFIADFFNSKDSYSLLLLIALVPLIKGFINPAIITFQKELKFQNEFWIRFILFLIESSLVVILASVTKNVSSFVWGLIVGAVIEVVLSFVFIKPLPKIKFELASIKVIIGKGKWLTALSIFSYIAREGDNAVVGKILGTSSLGLYQVAYKLSTLPLSEITDVLNKVVFPLYVKISDDYKRLFRAFFKISLINCFTAIILGTIIFIYAKEIILILVGDRWINAAPVVRILTVYGSLRAIFGTFSPLFLAVGRQDYVASMTFLRVVGLGITIVPFVMTYGIMGAGYAAIFSIIIELPVILYYAKKIYKERVT